jgi:hypothetical protein
MKVLYCIIKTLAILSTLAAERRQILCETAVRPQSCRIMSTARNPFYSGWAFSALPQGDVYRHRSGGQVRCGQRHADGGRPFRHHHVAQQLDPERPLPCDWTLRRNQLPLH